MGGAARATACPMINSLEDEPMTKHKPLPPVEELWRIFSYNPFTGQLLWREPPARQEHKLGAEVGCVNSSGYRVVNLTAWSPHNYRVHRIVWAWIYGEDPGDLTIDHANRNRADNRWHNLRVATHSQQNYNTLKKKKDSPYKGVYVVCVNGRKRIEARIKVNGKTVYLGRHATMEEAHSAYCKAAEHYHAQFRRTHE